MWHISSIANGRNDELLRTEWLEGKENASWAYTSSKSEKQSVGFSCSIWTGGNNFSEEIDFN